MAHVGRRYKLHFRRDLCVGCTDNEFAWPECFAVDLALTSLGPPVVTARFPNVNAPFQGPYDATDLYWRTATRTIFGQTMLAEVDAREWDVAANRQRLWIRFRIGEIEVGRIPTTSLAGGRCDTVNFGTGFGVTVTKVVASAWPAGDIRASGLITAAGWNRWPEAETP